MHYSPLRAPKSQAVSDQLTTNYKSLVILPILFYFAIWSNLAHADTENDNWLYKVQPGDSIWSISQDLLTNWREWQKVARFNNLQENDNIRPASFIRIPKSLVAERAATISIIKMSGAATIVVNGETKPLAADTVIETGAVIHTKESSSLLIEFEDKTQILLLENTELHVHTASMLGENNSVVNIRVEITHGEVEVNANPVKSANSYFLIHTPAAHATTRGTRYRIRADGDAMAAEVIEGDISVGNTQGLTGVRAGFGTVAYRGKVPQKPRKLLAKPVLASFEEAIRMLPSNIMWEPIAGAVQYRVQLSPASDFSTIVYDRVISQAKIALPITLKNSTYFMRVKGIDASGLQGKEAVALLVIDVRPLPAVPVIKSALADEETINISWLKGSDTERYQLQLSSDKEFKDILIDKNFTSTLVKLHRGDKEGNFYIRIRGVNQYNYPGDWSVSQKVAIEHERSGLYIFLSYVGLILLL